MIVPANSFRSKRVTTQLFLLYFSLPAFQFFRFLLKVTKSISRGVLATAIATAFLPSAIAHARSKSNHRSLAENAALNLLLRTLKRDHDPSGHSLTRQR
jgi:hypothetical protein